MYINYLLTLILCLKNDNIEDKDLKFQVDDISCDARKMCRNKVHVLIWNLASTGTLELWFLFSGLAHDRVIQKIIPCDQTKYKPLQKGL